MMTSWAFPRLTRIRRSMATIKAATSVAKTLLFDICSFQFAGFVPLDVDVAQKAREAGMPGHKPAGCLAQERRDLGALPVRRGRREEVSPGLPVGGPEQEEGSQ